MGKVEAEAKDEPMADASKEERSTSEELVPDDPDKAASHVALPPGIMAAMTEEAPDMPAEESDGTFVCPDCDVRPESVVRWHLHRAACHNVPLSKAIFPPPSAMDSYRQDFRGAVVPAVARRLVFRNDGDASGPSLSQPRARRRLASPCERRQDPPQGWHLSPLWRRL